MIPDYGGNVRRSSQNATDALLDEQVDIEETAPDAVPPPPPPGYPPAGFGPPPPPAENVTVETPRPSDGGRLGLLVPILLAALGLAAAVIAWRAGVAGSDAGDANLAGLDAGRERAAAVIIDEGLVSRATEAYLDYERARRRAQALADANVNDQAQLNRMEAVGHWFLVPPEYIDRTGQFQPGQQRAALLADNEQSKDIQPLAHFTVADTEYDRLRGLIGAGIVVAFALPFLTLAEIGRGRLRAISVLIGVVIFAAGIGLAAMAWLGASAVTIL